MKNHLCSFLSRLMLPGPVALFILLSPALVRADAITTFHVSGTARNVSGRTLGSCSKAATCTFSGMFKVDTTTGTVESSGFAFTFPGVPTTFPVASGFILASSTAQPPFWEIQVVNFLRTLPPRVAKDNLDLFFNTAPTPGSLKGFTRGFNLDGSVSALVTINGFRVGGGPLYAITRGSIGGSQGNQVRADEVLAPVPAPKPSTLLLFVSGMLALGLARRFGKKVGHPLSA